jgi:membrane dipeptidase
MRLFRLLTLLAAASAAAQNRAQKPELLTDAAVREVHRSAILIDTHNDVPTEMVTYGFDLDKGRDTGHTDVPRLKTGGLGAVFFAVYVPGSYAGKQSAHRALELFDVIRTDIIARNPGDFSLGVSVASIEAAHKRGKIAALIGVEGGHAIEESLRLLRTYYDLGARYMTLTHSNSTSWAGSSGDDGRQRGLSPFGAEVVREMNRLGMMVDISHVSDPTFWDALAISSAPPFASHSSCREIANVPRNLTDKMIAALGQKGGVVQVNLSCVFLSQAAADASASPAFRARMKQAGGPAAPTAVRRKAFNDALREVGVRVTIGDVLAHIDRVVKIAGIDAVGIGSDFDGVPCTPEGLEDVSKFPNLTRALLERGYSPSNVRKIYGGNLLRVFRATERVADRAATRQAPNSTK